MKQEDLEDINSLYESRDEVVTKKDIAFRTVCTESLSRILDAAKNRDFAILTAYRKSYTKEENVLRNRKLRGELNAMQLGVHPLIGHWRECTVPGVPYEECPVNKLVDVVERSYFVFRNDSTSTEDFKKIIMTLGKKYEQDAVILKLGKETKVVMLNSDDSFSIGTTVTLGKVAQAYSQYVRNLNAPFVFEGIETPTAVSSALKAIHDDGFRW